MWKPMPATNNDWLNKFQRPATNEPMDTNGSQAESNLVRRLCISSKAASSWIWLWPVTGFFCLRLWRLWAGQLGIHWWFLGPVMAADPTSLFLLSKRYALNIFKHCTLNDHLQTHPNPIDWCKLHVRHLRTPPADGDTTHFWLQGLPDVISSQIKNIDMWF